MVVTCIINPAIQAIAFCFSSTCFEDTRMYVLLFWRLIHLPGLHYSDAWRSICLSYIHLTFYPPICLIVSTMSVCLSFSLRTCLFFRLPISCLFFETLYGGQSTLPIQLIKPKLSYHSSIFLLQGETWIKSWEAIHIVFGGSGVEIVAFGILGDRRFVWDFNNYFSGGTINMIIWIFQGFLHKIRFSRDTMVNDMPKFIIKHLINLTIKTFCPYLTCSWYWVKLMSETPAFNESFTLFLVFSGITSVSLTVSFSVANTASSSGIR